MTIFYCDHVGGNNANTGLSFAQRKKDFSSFSGGSAPAAGDTIRVMQSPDPVSLSVTSSWTNNSSIVQITSGDLGQCVTSSSTSGWSGVAGESFNSVGTAVGVAGSVRVDSYSTPYSGQIDINLGSTNFSAYQIITFMIKCSAPIAAGDLEVGFVSGSSGFNTFDIPDSVWTPVSIDYGGSMPAGGGSLFFSFNSYAGANFSISNVCFVPNGGLTFLDLIGKNTSNETWYCVKNMINSGSTTGSIDYIYLDRSTTLDASTSGVSKYYGTTESVTLYKRATISALVGFSTFQSVPYTNGTLTNPVIISGGWDSTNMSSQTGETYIDGRVGQGTGVSQGGTNVYYEKYYHRRFTIGYQSTGGGTFGELGAGNCSDTGVYLTTGPVNINVVSAFGSDYGLYTTGQKIYIPQILHGNSNSTAGLRSSGQIKLGTADLRGNTNVLNGNTLIENIDVSYAQANYGLYINTQYPVTINKVTCSGGSIQPVYIDNCIGNISIYSLTSSSTAAQAATVAMTSSGQVIVYIGNISTSEATPVVVNTVPMYTGSVIKLQNVNSISTNIDYCDGGTIETDISDRHTASGLAWKTTVTDAKRDSSYPLELLISPIPVESGQTLTFKIWAKKSHATNVSAEIVIPGGRFPGISSDIVQTISSTSYTQYTLTATPTANTVLEVFVRTWTSNGSTNVYSMVHDMSIS